MTLQKNDQDEVSQKTISLSALRNGAPGLTADMGGSLAEAASVCLEQQGHKTNVCIDVDGSFKTKYSLLYLTITEQMRRCYHDSQEATENGACGIALLLVQDLIGLTSIFRSRKGTGFDYWLGQDSEESDPLNFMSEKARLEVSGILNGKQHVMKRVREKLRQVEPSDGCLPAYIVVVEFGSPMAHIAHKAGGQ